MLCKSSHQLLLLLISSSQLLWKFLKLGTNTLCHFLPTLLAMRSFVAHCPELLTEDVIRRLMTPIECAMTMMSQ